MLFFCSGRLFKPLETSLNGLFHLSCFWCRRETWHGGFAWAVLISHPLFLITGLTQVAFLIRVACVCLVKFLAEAALFFMAEGLGWRPEPGIWQDGMDPAEDRSCHGPSKHDHSFGDTTKEHWAVPSAHPASGQGVGEAWCKEHWGPRSSSSLGLEVTWWFKYACFLPIFPSSHVSFYYFRKYSSWFLLVVLMSNI